MISWADEGVTPLSLSVSSSRSLSILSSSLSMMTITWANKGVSPLSLLVVFKIIKIAVQIVIIIIAVSDDENIGCRWFFGGGVADRGSL